jgi:hypothetical protein
MVGNAFRAKDSTPLRPTDFVPGYQRPPQTAEEQLAIFLAIKDAQNSEQVN